MASSGEKHLIFVYGTLKQGQPYFAKYTADRSGGREAELVSVAETEHSFPLVIITRFNIPALLPAEGQGKHVRGELYEINSTMLMYMDSLEGCPRYYERMPLSVRLMGAPSSATSLKDSKEGDVVQCEVYFFTDFKPEILTDRPHFKEYNAYDEPRFVTGDRRQQGGIEGAFDGVKTLSKPMFETVTELRRQRLKP